MGAELPRYSRRAPERLSLTLNNSTAVVTGNLALASFATGRSDILATPSDAGRSDLRNPNFAHDFPSREATAKKPFRVLPLFVANAIHAK